MALKTELERFWKRYANVALSPCKKRQWQQVKSSSQLLSCCDCVKTHAYAPCCCSHIHPR